MSVVTAKVYDMAGEWLAAVELDAAPQPGDEVQIDGEAWRVECVAQATEELYSVNVSPT